MTKQAELVASIRDSFKDWPDDTWQGIAQEFGEDVADSLKSCCACPSHHLPNYTETRLGIFSCIGGKCCTRCRATDIAIGSQKGLAENYKSELVERRERILSQPVRIT